MAKTATKKKSKKDNVIEVNFEGVKAFKTIPEGAYTIEVTEVSKEKSSQDNDMLKWEFAVTEGKFKGSKLWHNTSLVKAALFKLREVLEGLGLEVPDDVMGINLDDLVGLTCGVNVLHEDYQGKPQARIVDFISADDVEESDDEDDEKPTKGKKKASKDDEEDASIPDVDSMDEDELAELIADEGLDVDLEDYRTLKKQRAAVAEALEGSSEEEDDEEPAKGKKKSKKEDVETYSADTVSEMDLEELQALNDDNDLGVEDIEDMKVKVAVKAVTKALKKAGLLED